jgi:hypothetical protein
LRWCSSRCRAEDIVKLLTLKEDWTKDIYPGSGGVDKIEFSSLSKSEE